MAFNGSSTVSATGAGTGGGGSGASSGDGPHNKRLCTGKENNEAGLNNNRVSNFDSSINVSLSMINVMNAIYKKCINYLIWAKELSK